MWKNLFLIFEKIDEIIKEIGELVLVIEEVNKVNEEIINNKIIIFIIDEEKVKVFFKKRFEEEVKFYF